MNIPYISENKNGWLTISGIGDLSVFRTFDCGQCFRFDPVEHPLFETDIGGIAFGKYVRFAQSSDNSLYIYSSPEDFEAVWRPFLSLDTDYERINQSILSPLEGNDRLHMEKAISCARGIRILRQDPWEALCSFIISQNNNIPRIKKIIRALCERYGEKLPEGFAFPTPEALCRAGVEDIFSLKTGFRAKYIHDAAVKVADGRICEQRIRSSNYADAEKELMTIQGVGPKVAACTLLFGYEKLCAFPVDVWIKRVISRRFPKGLDPTVFGEYAGIAQQYLFYYERYIGD